MQFGESLKDFALTMLLPTVLMVSTRIAPRCSPKSLSKLRAEPEAPPCSSSPKAGGNYQPMVKPARAPTLPSLLKPLPMPALIAALGLIIALALIAPAQACR